MEKTRVGRWVGEWVEIRIIGPTGGFQTAGLCNWTDEEHTLVSVGDAIVTPDTEGEIVEGGIIRVDWTTIGTLKMLQDMTKDVDENPEDYDEEDDVVFEGDDDALLEWLEQFKPEEDDEDE